MIRKSNNHANPPGKFISHNIKLEPHEQETINFFLARGEDIEQIIPSNTPKNKCPDFYMRGLEWESKCPYINSLKSINALFYSALQQSNNVVFDLRHMRGQDQTILSHLLKLFTETRRVKNLLIITKSEQLVELAKK